MEAKGDAIRLKVLELLRKYGTNTCSFQALESGLQYWFDGDDACVAYLDTGAAWIAAGEPIADPERVEETIHRFCIAARENGRRPRLFALENLPSGTDLRALKIGTQPIWDPMQWEATLQRKRSLREQLRRARAKGVAIRELEDSELTPDHETRKGIDQVVERWRQSRTIAPMGFLVEVDVYHTASERRFFVAEQGSRLVGLLVAVPIFALDGWFFEDVLRDPDAPNGTVELLFDHAMRSCAREGSRHATFGLAPLSEVPSRPLAWIRDRSSWLYDFDGLKRFKAKLEPQRWDPVYLGFPKSERGIMAIIDSLRAFARGSLTRFAWQTLIHRARLVVLLLVVLLLPWTAILAALPANYFPSRAIQFSWVVADLIVLVGLASLLHRWRRSIATSLALVATLDTFLGIAQFALYNISRLESIIDVFGAMVALLGPMFAAAFLWSAKDRYKNDTPPASATS